jgi:hypothetical protein
VRGRCGVVRCPRSFLAVLACAEGNHQHQGEHDHANVPRTGAALPRDAHFEKVPRQRVHGPGPLSAAVPGSPTFVPFALTVWLWLVHPQQMYTMMSTARRAHPDTALMVERMKARRQYFRMQFLIKLYQSSLKNRPQREKPEAPVHHFSVVAPDHAPAAGRFGTAFSSQASPSYLYNSQQESEAERSGRMITRGVSSRQSTPIPSPTAQPGGSATPAMMPFATSQGMTFMAPMGGTGTPMSMFPMKTEGGYSMMAPFPLASPDGGFPMIPVASAYMLLSDFCCCW